MKQLHIAIIVGVLCTACVSTEVKEGVAECDALPEVSKDLCLQNVAVKSGEPKACSGIRNSGVRVPCIVAVAIASCDQEVCNAITESWKRPSCKLQVAEAPQCATQ